MRWDGYGDGGKGDGCARINADTPQDISVKKMKMETNVSDGHGDVNGMGMGCALLEQTGHGDAKLMIFRPILNPPSFWILS